MGCAASAPAKKVDTGDIELVDSFVAVVRDDSSAWKDRRRAVDGPRGTRLEVREGPEGLKYWRGMATIRAPLDIVAWFIRNQTEFNSLARTIDVDVLGTEIADMTADNVTEVVQMLSSRHAKLKWLLTMPEPLPPREFFVSETTRQLSDGSLAIVCQSQSQNGKDKKARSKSGGSLSRSNSKATEPDEQQSTRGSAVGAPPHEDLMALISRQASAVGIEGDSAQGSVLLSGYLLEGVNEKYTKAIFVSCMDPCLSDADYEAVSTFRTMEGDDPSAGANSDKAILEGIREAKQFIADFLGKNRVLQMLESPRRYFEDPKTIWAEQLFRMCSAEIGEYGFEAVEAAQYGEDKLQTGTHVIGKNMGQGIIKMFDIFGNAHVRFDSGEERVYKASEIEQSLSTAVEVGTRIRHPDRGLGTVKRFDDDSGRIHVKFDSGEYHRYKAGSWKEKIKIVDKAGKIYENVSISKCPQVELEGITTGSVMQLTAGVQAPGLQSPQRAGSLTKTKSQKSVGGGKKKEKKKARSRQLLISAEAQRISFVIGAPAEEILDFVLSFKEEEKSGIVKAEKVIKEHSDTHQTMYQRVKYPQGMNDRDFVYDSFWREVERDTFLVVQKSTETDEMPPIQNVVRANLVIRGYLIEPLYDTESGEEQDYLSRVTFLTCVEPNGFVPPKVIETQNRTELIGALTDMRSYFHTKKARVRPAGSGRGPHRVAGSAAEKLARRSMRRKSTLTLEMMQQFGEDE